MDRGEFEATSHGVGIEFRAPTIEEVKNMARLRVSEHFGAQSQPAFIRLRFVELERSIVLATAVLPP
jgi:hypothetical protein